MKTPPLLLAAALLFWGWQTDLVYFAALMALVLEGARVFQTRWEMSEPDFRRLWNLSTVLFVGATVYAFSSHDGTSGLASLFERVSAATRSESLNRTSQSVLALMQLLPLIFFPLAVAQAYSTVDAIDLRAFSWIARRRMAAGAMTGMRPPALNLAYPYYVICLLASSTAHQHEVTFFAGLSSLLVWALWCQRNRRFSPLSWAALVLTVVATGYAGHLGLYQLQRALQNLDALWLSRFSHTQFDAKGIRTSLGAVGKMKLSGRIVLRVEPETDPPPALLREASYNQFETNRWFSSRKRFQSVLDEGDDKTWNLLPPQRPPRSVKIARYLPHGQGLLPVPIGTWQLEELPVYILKTNPLGVLKVDAGPGLVQYRARYGDNLTMDSPPEPDDLTVPASDAATLARVADELGLRSLPPTQAVAVVTAYFNERFQYSTLLPQEPPPDGRTPLADFLLNRRAGHCEFFATATVLLLRQAGIHTRYAVGYSVQEHSGRTYLVRQRHAHAWCLVHCNGRWDDLDTTPPSWQALEAAQSPFWEPFYDFWSSLWFSFSKWRWGQASFRPYVFWLMLPPLLLAAGRLLYKRHWRRARTLPGPAQARIVPGLDSEFYLIEQRLHSWGLTRSPDEPLFAWLNRTPLPPAVPRPRLEKLLALHYRYRFDPDGLSAAERQTLTAESRAWLEQASP